MNRYNDYTNITRQWLKRYNDFHAASVNLKKEVNEREKHFSQEDQIKRLKADINEIELVLNKIDQALANLNDEAADILKERYIKKESCIKLASKYNYSEPWIRKKSSKAIKQMALIMFGMKATSNQTSFVFAV